MAPGADLTAQSPPVRIPKLKYRIPLPDSETTPSLLEPRRDSAQQPRDPEEPPPTPSFKAPSSEYAPSFDTASLTSSSLASTAASVASSDDSRSSKKKKKTGVLSFLSLREPSKDAFKQFAEAQRKQAAEKGTPSPPASHRPLSTYPAKKLPENIPKVNSKWDGIPESIKTKNHKSPASSKKNRNSIQSQKSQRSQSSQSSQTSAGTWNLSNASVVTDGTKNPPNSVASPVESVASLAPPDRSRSTSPSPLTTTLPEMSYYFPRPLNDSAAFSEPHPDVYHPSIFENTPRSSTSTPDLGSPLSPLPGLRPDSPASSTGSADTVVRETADAIFKKLNDQPQKSLWGDAPAVHSPDDDIGMTVPESHEFLFDDQPSLESSQSTLPMASSSIPHYTPTRPVLNFSRPMSSHASPPRPTRAPSYRATPITSALPTLYEASVASTDSVHSTDSDETIQDDKDTDSYSIAPSTVAQSVLSAHWHDSPRERLGLGGHLRLDAESPWENQEKEPGKAKKYRLSMFGKVTPRA